MPKIVKELVNKTIKIKDKEFELFIPEKEILKAVEKLAKDVSSNFKGSEPIFISVLNGSFMFSSDFLKRVDLSCQISFIKVASYDGTETTSVVKSLIGFNEEIAGKDIIILEDIIDTGITIEYLINEIKKFNPKSVNVVTLLFKPEVSKKECVAKYVGIEIPNKFVVGYGLDYVGYGRNFKDIYILKKKN